VIYLPEIQASKTQLIFLCRNLRGQNIGCDLPAENTGTKNTVVAGLPEFLAKKWREIFTPLIRFLFK
jgi:hypothetical protein